MPDRIDHAAEAQRLLHQWSREAMPVAQAHATLALVEQLRIGNLIALANASHMSESFDDTEEAQRQAAYKLIAYLVVIMGSPRSTARPASRITRPRRGGGSTGPAARRVNARRRCTMCVSRRFRPSIGTGKPRTCVCSARLRRPSRPPHHCSTCNPTTNPLNRGDNHVRYRETQLETARR